MQERPCKSQGHAQATFKKSQGHARPVAAGNHGTWDYTSVVHATHLQPSPRPPTPLRWCHCWWWSGADWDPAWCVRWCVPSCPPSRSGHPLSHTPGDKVTSLPKISRQVTPLPNISRRKNDISTKHQQTSDISDQTSDISTKDQQTG